MQNIKGKRDVLLTGFCNSNYRLLRRTLVLTYRYSSKGKRDVL